MSGAKGNWKIGDFLRMWLKAGTPDEDQEVKSC